MLKILTLFLFCINGLLGQSIKSQFQTVIDSIFNANQASSGILVHVESPEKNISWSGASGYADRNLKTKLNAEQPALIASSIKTYVAATVLKLVENGKLHLETPIDSKLTKKTIKLFEKDNYDFSSIQIKHLLSHTSGIEDYANADYIDFKDKNPMYKWTRDEQLALAVEVGNPLGEPGQQFSYADANYLLLTEIIENVTGKSFYSAMRKLLKYDELGINNTWFPTLEDRPENTLDLVHQYWGSKNWDSANMDVSWDLYGGGGIACPTKDLALFVHNFFNGRIVENDSIQNLIFTEIKTKETEVYPYYLGLSESTYHGMKAYGHGGFWGTVMMHFPSINSSIAVYILDRDHGRLRGDVLKALSEILVDKYALRLASFETPKEEPELEQIRQTLMDYIEGTGNGEPDRLRRAFHPDFNLYTVTEQDSLRIRSGEKYISGVKEGQKTSRVGRIIAIDHEKDAASAKVEIVIPGWRIFTDYFLLLKYEGSWKIVQKSYSWREIPAGK